MAGNKNDYRTGIREYVRKQGEDPRKPGNPNLMK